MVNDFHDARTVLFLQWRHSRNRGERWFSGKKNRTTEFATARIFNKLGEAVRGIDEKYKIFDKEHIRQLKNALTIDIQRDIQSQETQYDPRPIAEALAKAAAARTNEQAWAWTVLPTFPKQHYGRILVDMTDNINGVQAFITQPTFSDGQATLLHTHGQNWAWSVPLGQPGSGKNRHLNTLHRPKSREQLFPLERLGRRKKDKAYYSAGDVAVIPPKVIHGIEGARFESLTMTIEEFASLSPEKRKEVLANTRPGEHSSLHIYRGDKTLVKDFKTNPVEFIPGKPQRDLFEQIDMIVFDETSNPPQAWAGGGGAWAHRLIEHGKKGDHCGECFKEKEFRMGGLPAKVVWERFIDPSFPGLIFYPASELTGTRLKRRK